MTPIRPTLEKMASTEQDGRDAGSNPAVEQENTREILDNLFAFVALLDPKGVILEINRAPLERGGYKRGDIIGQLFYDTPWWSYDPQVRLQLISAVDAAAKGERIRYDVTNRMLDEIVTIDFQLSPLFSDDGQVRRLLATATDITDRKRAEAALVQQIEILDEAQVVSRLGVWTFDFATQEAKASVALRRLLNLKPGVELTPETYLSLTHPDDRAMVGAHWEGVLRGEPKAFSHRNIINGQVQWINARTKMSFDLDGNPQFAIGTIQDITEQKRAELKIEQYQGNLEEIIQERAEELNQANRKLREIVFALESVGTAILWNDAKTGKFTAVNKHAAEIFGYSTDELIGKSVFDIDPSFSPEFYQQFLPVLRENGFLRIETTGRRKDGALIPLEMTIYHQPTVAGEPDHVLAFGVEITERKAAEQALLEAKTQAEAASKAKSAFLATVSHEIRTPMNAIVGMALLTLKTELTRRQRDYQEKILHSSQLLLGIINDILDAAKLESGKMALDITRFDLAALLDKIIPQIEGVLHAKNLDLLIDISPAVPRLIIGDELRLGQVLLNLASNAVKFTESGRIVIRVRSVDQRNCAVVIRFEVSDTGIGLTTEQIKGLFQSFHQADNSITRQYGGSGLGLAISKNLVELMGGEIGVESVPDEGSTFWFTIKANIERAKLASLHGAKELRGARALIIDDHRRARMVLEKLLQRMGIETASANGGKLGLQELLKSNLQKNPIDFVFIHQVMPGMAGLELARQISDLSLALRPKCILLSGQAGIGLNQAFRPDGFCGVLHLPVSPSRLREVLMHCLAPGVTDEVPEKTPADGPPEEAKQIFGARALLVEDNELNQEVAIAFLSELGLLVDVAENGAKAIEMVQQSPYQIVLMDMQMPLMDGLTATREIRKEPRFRDLPIVAMTANAMEADRQRCLNAGMNDYIAKPIDPQVLVDKLAKWIKADTIDHLAAVSPARFTQGVNDSRTDLELLRDIGGLDVDRGLTRCLMQPKLYISLLRKFLAGQKDVLVDISHAIASGRWENAERIAHTLKGVAGQIGADRVSDHAGRLENILREPTDVTTVDKMLNELSYELRPIIDGLEHYSETIEVPRPPSKMPQWLEVREELIRLLAEDDVACVEISESNRELLRDKLGSRYQGFARSIEVYDFPSALDVLIGVSLNQPAKPLT